MMQSNDLTAPNGAKRASLATWLFNPFQYVAGWASLGIGLAVLAIVSLLSPVANVHFDGVLDVHIGAQAPWWFFWAENYLDWLVMGLLALLSGKIFSKSRVRAVDALGTQALARFPTLLTALIMCLPGVTSVNMALIRLLETPEALTDAKVLMSQLATSGVTALDGVQFAVALLATIVLTVWAVVLMYRAWATACNFSGGKSVAWFIGLLLLGEILSKILIIQLLPLAGITVSMDIPATQTASADATTVERRTELVQSAGEFVDMLVAGEFGKAVATFDTTMSKALPEAKLSETWASIIGQVGAFRSRGEATVKKEAGFNSVYVPCTFEKGTLSAKVVFDKDGRVTGLWFK